TVVAVGSDASDGTILRGRGLRPHLERRDPGRARRCLVLFAGLVGVAGDLAPELERDAGEGAGLIGRTRPSALEQAPLGERTADHRWLTTAAGGGGAARAIAPRAARAARLAARARAAFAASSTLPHAEIDAARPMRILRAAAAGARVATRSLTRSRVCRAAADEGHAGTGGQDERAAEMSEIREREDLAHRWVLRGGLYGEGPSEPQRLAWAGPFWLTRRR